MIVLPIIGENLVDYHVVPPVSTFAPGLISPKLPHMSVDDGKVNTGFLIRGSGVRVTKGILKNQRLGVKDKIIIVTAATL